MKKALMLAAVALVAGAIPATASSDNSRERDLAAFRQIRDQQANAWFTENGSAFAATFTTNADLVTFNGDHRTTRAGIAAGMQYYFDKYIDHTRLLTTNEDIRFAGPDLAIIVRTSCQLEPPSTTCRPDSLSRNTNVLVKVHGRWQQESFQNTRVVALP